MTHSAFLAGLSPEEERKVEELEGAVAHLLKVGACHGGRRVVGHALHKILGGWRKHLM